MIFFILLLFYVHGAFLEDEFFSDHFGNSYTIIPVLSEVKYPKRSLGVKARHAPNYWDPYLTDPKRRRHLKKNETKEALQSETTGMVFDLLKKLNLSVDYDLVNNLILLANKFNMNVSNVSQSTKVLREAEMTSAWDSSDSKISDATTLASKYADDYDYYDYKTVEVNKNLLRFRANQSATSNTCVTIVESNTTQIKFNATTQTPTKKPTNIPRNTGILKKIPGIWIDGRCRCNHIFRSGSHKMNPHFYLIIFLEISLSCLFDK